MASYEILQQTAICVCGQGKLERDVYSSNQSFGGIWKGQANIACAKCSKYWKFNTQDNLVPKDYLKPVWIKQSSSDALNTKIQFIQKEINNHIEAALLREFNRVSATTKAAQHRLLQKSNLNVGSYRQYLRDGLRSVLSKIDPDSIIGCKDLVKELEAVKYELQELQAQYQLWHLDNKHHLFYKTDWRLFS